MKKSNDPRYRDSADLLLELIDDNILEKEEVLLACLKYMSERQVAEMANLNRFWEVFEDEDLRE